MCHSRVVWTKREHTAYSLIRPPNKLMVEITNVMIQITRHHV